MIELEKYILFIIKSHVGFDDAINQYKMTQKINDIGGDTNCRQVRKVIEDLIKQGYPIISTPRNGGGYCYQKTTLEGVECWKRIRRQAIKLFIKARKIRSNSRIGQLDLDIRF
jgi:hypothetical protein